MRGALALVLALCPWAAAAQPPTLEQVRAAHRPSDAVLLDRHGEPVQSLRIDMDARRLHWVAFADISPAMRRAIVHAEDQRFMQHGGVDLRAMGKAALDSVAGTGSRGASTITMQLAAMLDPALARGKGGRTLGQKWDQALAAREIEAAWSKQQILEAYLNLAPFRGEMRGIGAAARGLFGKAASGLNETEAVIAASLVRAPGASPRTVARRACALARAMQLAAPCSGIEWDTLRALDRPAASAAMSMAAPQVARKLLSGASANARSTLDAGLQRYATAALRQRLAALRERNVNDGAVVVLDNASGDILAYVGNAGDVEVDGVAAPRQAGSTLKPFLYALAIERRLLTAASLVDDAPLDIATAGGMYVPNNYDRQFKGYVSVRNALAGSLNVPAVRTLQLVGVERFLQRLRALGLGTIGEDAGYYGFALALGSAEVTLLDLANAYRTLANGGMAGTPALAPRAPEQRRRVADAVAAWIVSDILSDRAARSVTFGLRNDLATTYWAAVKTGTSKDMRDNWAVGYSARYTVGVWVGNFDGRPMWDVSGVTGAAPLWRDVMDYLHAHTPGQPPAAPPGVVKQSVSFDPALEPPREEAFLAGTATAVVALVTPQQRNPRILYPADGALLALDPDIPEQLERVSFSAQAGQGLYWQLNGERLAPADVPLSWRPVAGRHKLALVDGQGRVAVAHAFQVRGNER
ncbi:penicillin-binding protein 1C [Pseudoduganella sp. GCM10020061]|uniref:penicillin-binding protein 1C n=1 Tax=Pseudoduganella sp. GCM10020061 TaxID=3317345 RepID=UPI00362EDA48